MKSVALMSAAVACVVMSAGGLRAAQLATAPATTPAVSENMIGTVTGVEGIVQVREAEDQPWQKVTLGMKVSAGAELRTGPKSAVRIAMPPDQTIVLDRLGTVKILEAMRDPTKVKTELGVKYGRVRYNIEAAGLEHDSVIRSPSSALAVRGSGAYLDDNPAFGAEYGLNHGHAEYKTSSGKTYTFGSGEDQKETLTVSTDVSSPAYTAQSAANSPPVSTFALTNTEALLIAQNSSVAGVTTSFANFPKPNSGPGGNPGSVLPEVPYNTLSFNLSWTGESSAGRLADLNLFVITPGGQTLTAGQSGGLPPGVAVSANDRGGKGATLGVESVQWGVPAFTAGTYTYGVSFSGKGDPATFQIIVLGNNQQINAPFEDTLTSDGETQTYAITLNSSGAVPGGTSKVQAAAKAKPAAAKFVGPRLPRASRGR